MCLSYEPPRSCTLILNKLSLLLKVQVNKPKHDYSTPHDLFHINVQAPDGHAHPSGGVKVNSSSLM